MNWEEFYMDLQEEMPGEDVEYDYVREPGGDELLVAYWGYQNIGKRDHMYLQIHKGWPEERSAGADGDHFLGFRVAVGKKDNLFPEYQTGIRNCLHRLLMEVVSDHPWGRCVCRPRYFGVGRTMNYGVTTDQSCWLARNDDGQPNINRTIEGLQIARIILRDVAQRFRQAFPNGFSP